MTATAGDGSFGGEKRNPQEDQKGDKVQFYSSYRRLSEAESIQVKIYCRKCNYWIARVEKKKGSERRRPKVQKTPVGRRAVLPPGKFQDRAKKGS